MLLMLKCKILIYRIQKLIYLFNILSKEKLPGLTDDARYDDSKPLEHGIVSVSRSSGPWNEDLRELKPCWEKPEPGTVIQLHYTTRSLRQAHHRDPAV